MLEANPLMTPNEIKQWLELNSLDLGAAGKDEKFGSGLIDLTNLDKITVSENNTPVFNSINIARNVLTGTENEIIVNVTDNEEIVEVNALIVNPLNEEITFNLIESNNDFWSATFLDTNTTGTYLVELRAVDNQGLQAITSISFNAVESFNDLNQSDLNFTGSQTELFVPEEIIKEEQGLVSLNLFLVAPSEFALEISPKDTTVEFYVKDSAGNIIEKEFVGPIEVPVNQPMDFNYFWGSSIVNDYNIGAVILSEGIQAGIQEKSTLVTVTENSAEITFFGLNENPIEKGITQNYVVNAVNTSEHELSSFIEILYFDSNNNVVHAFSGNKILIEPNSAHLFDENETILLKPGNYELNAILHFENKIVSVNPVNVSVFVPEIGLIESIEIPEEVPVDENLNIKIYFRNNGAIEINPVFFVEIIDGNETISILNFGGEDINAGKTRLFDENWATKVKPGDYNLNITVFYGNAEHEINLTENFSVIDVQEPLLKNILFNNNLMQNKPLLIKAEFNDSSELNVVVSIQGTEYLMNKNSFFGRDSNWNYTFVDTENSGEYFFQITACDEFSNCFTAPENSFTVNQLPAGCSGNKVLVAEQEQNLGSLINSDYCVTEWSLKENGVPSLEYLNRFNAVIWSEGNNINAIDENTSADALIEFVLNGGKILLEGQDIAFSHFDDNLMQFVAHSALFSDLILDENSNESIIVSKKHPITFPLNEIEFNYELSQFPDAVIPTENAFSLAEWNSRNTAINLFNDFNDTNAKTVFFAFNLNALNQETKTILLNNSIEWLLENASEDLIVNEILVPEFVVEGQEFDVNVLLDNTITTIQPKIELYADGELIQSINSNQESILFPVSLSKGLHEIKVFINPDFSFQEKFYLNNSQKKELQVYPLQADLTINSISAETEDKILISAEIQNKGGSTARNALTEIFVDGTKIQEKTNSFNPNQTITVNALTDKNIGLHEIQVKINDSNMVSEDDYSNNSLTKELYVCNKNNILIINDNNTENFSSDNPDSTKSITSILKENNYCFKEWNEKIQGTPEISFLNSFNLIFWSTGNYWNTVINENDTQLLEQFEGNIIFEGADIAFDHAGETFLEEKLHAVFDKDLILKTTNLNLNEHRILSGINEILLDENYSPYPDSLIPVNAFSVALWPEAETAVLASDSNNSVYFGFSLNAVSDSSTKEKLVLNSVDWIEESNSVCGDLTGDSQFNVADLTFFVDFLWKGGPEPYPLWTANADGTDSVNVADLTYLVNFLWKGGPAPHCAPAEELKSGNPTQKITLNEIQELIKKNTINQTKHQKTGLKSI